MKYFVSFFVFVSFMPYLTGIALAADATGPAAPAWASSPSASACPSDLKISNVKDALGKCQPKGVITAENYIVEDGARKRVLAFADKLTIFAAVLAIGAVVYSGIMFVLSLGDEEKIKKAKGALKTSLIGFLLALISYALVNAIINFAYNLK
jgi:hypothetical protein